MGQTKTVEFDPFSRDFFDDPYDTYADLRDHAPCYFSEQYDFYALSRFDDVVTAHRDFETFTSTHGQTYEQLASGEPADMGSIISMDPPEHTRYRKLVSRSFTPRSIGNYEALVRDIISGYLDPLMGRRQFDILEEFAAPFPVEIISTILGVPAEDRQQIRHWTDEMLHREEGSAMGSQGAAEAGMAQGMYLFQLSQQKRAEPADDMLTALIEAEVETEDGEPPPTSTTPRSPGSARSWPPLAPKQSPSWWAMLSCLFHRHPDQWAKVLNDPTVIGNAVEEILRYWAPSQYQGRFSTVDSEWHGVTIPKDKPVFLVTGAANRDPRRYDDPDRFDITREPGLAVGLGHGLHVCLGAALARLESRVAIEEIARRWPAFEVNEEGLRRVQMSNVAGYSSVPITVS